MPVILSCSLSLYRADVFCAMPTKPVAKKPIPGKPQAVKALLPVVDNSIDHSRYAELEDILANLPSQ
jgi:hypothetical protein